MAYFVMVPLLLAGIIFKRWGKLGNKLLMLPMFLPQFLMAQKITAPIVLINEQLPITAKEFYVAAVADDRDDRRAVAWLLPASATNTISETPYIVDLKGGVLPAIKQFVSVALPPDRALRPITIRIKKLRLDESVLSGGHVEGRLKVSLFFYLQRGGDQQIHLIDYTGSAGYNRPAGQLLNVEPVLRHALEYGLTYFNTWINREADTNIKLAKGTRIIFTDYTEQPEGDTIYYSAKRPLRWDDFKAKPIGGKYEAEVFPSIGYNEEVEVVKGVVNVKLAVKAYVPKSACWVRAGSRNDYSLNHEQRHFDIVKIIAERFKQKLRTEKLTVDNYDGPINVQYLESFHEMNVMQDQYDDETRHGTNPFVQQQWNDKIDKELAGFR